MQSAEGSGSKAFVSNPAAHNLICTGILLEGEPTRFNVAMRKIAKPACD
jgi:hypothetical protein